MINLKTIATTSSLAILMATNIAVQPGMTKKTIIFGDSPGKSGLAPGQNKVCKNNNGIGNNYDVEYNIGNETRSVRIDPGNKGQISKFKGDLAAEGFSTTEIDNAVQQLVDAEKKAKGSGVNCPTTSSVSSDYSTMYDHLSGLPFYRADLQPTKFHNDTYNNGKVGSDAFQQFANVERKKLDLKTIAARVLDPAKLVLKEDANVKIYFINEGAGYRNQLKLSTTGTTQIDEMIFNDVSCRKTDASGKRTKCIIGNDKLSPEDALNIGDYVDVGTVKGGTTLDFQVLQNGYGKKNPTTWYTKTSLNKDKLQHVIAYEYQGYLILGWEDLTNGGDMDYNDVVFVVDVGEVNLKNFPSGNQLPNAKDDSASTDANTPITINVLEGDTDPDGDSLTLDKVDSKSKKKGSITKNSDGTVTYTPATGYTGKDWFYYYVSDGQGGKDKGKVTVQVNNKVPTAINKTAITDENTPVSIDVITGNSDPDGHTLSIDLKADQKIYSNNGEAQISSSDNKFLVYTPNSGFTGEDTFSYTISDGHGGTATATVTVTVNGIANTAPTAQDDTASTMKNVAVDIDVLANDSDADGDTLTVTNNFTNVTNGTVTLNNDGTVKFTPDTDFVGIGTFTYTISDGKGGESTSTVTVNVLANVPD